MTCSRGSQSIVMSAVGKPTLRGTPAWVGLILGLLANGLTIEELLRDYLSRGE